MIITISTTTATITSINSFLHFIAAAINSTNQDHRKLLFSSFASLFKRHRYYQDKATGFKTAAQKSKSSYWNWVEAADSDGKQASIVNIINDDKCVRLRFHIFTWTSSAWCWASNFQWRCRCLFSLTRPLPLAYQLTLQVHCQERKLDVPVMMILFTNG